MQIRTLFPWLVTAVVAGCAVAPPDVPAGDPAGGKADGAGDFVVNGHSLTTRERQWMQYVADHVVGSLPGDRDRQLEIAARTAWWSLKEGIFDTSNAPKYSNCNSSSGDHLIGPLDTCGSGRAWQVGLAAVQVPNHTLSELETLAQQLYPDETVDEILADAAAEAGYDATSSTSQAIVEATGSLRKSWLLRNSAIGFAACERNEVVPECIEGSRSWCYGTGWDTTKRYAPNKAAAMRAIADIQTLLAHLSGNGSQPPVPWIGSPCTTDTDCDYGGGSQGFCARSPDGKAGFCSLACEGYCPDRSGHAQTFCIAGDAGGGMCAAKSDALNQQCAAIPETMPVLEDRYVGATTISAATATVCTF